MEQFVEFLTSDRYAVYRSIFTYLGAAYVLKVLATFLWSAAGGFCTYFLAPWGISSINLKKYGSWASKCDVLYICVK